MAENKPKEIRRQEILDAAAHCFAEKGFLGTSIDDICSQSELTKGGLYWHFKSKKQILEELVDYQCQQWQGEWDRLAELEINEDSIYRAGLLFITNKTAQPEKVRLYAMLEAEALRDASLGDVIRKTKESLLENLTRFSKQILDFYKNKSIEPKDLARILDIQVTGIVRQYVLFGRIKDLEVVWKNTFNVIRSGLI